MTGRRKSENACLKDGVLAANVQVVAVRMIVEVTSRESMQISKTMDMKAIFVQARRKQTHSAQCKEANATKQGAKTQSSDGQSVCPSSHSPVEHGTDGLGVEVQESIRVPLVLEIL